MSHQFSLFKQMTIPFFREERTNFLLFVKITPKASFNTIKGVIKEDNQLYLKIFIKEAAENNKANKELINFLSSLWGIPKSSVIIKKGLKSRRKILSLEALETLKKIFLTIPFVDND